MERQVRGGGRTLRGEGEREGGPGRVELGGGIRQREKRGGRYIR